MNILILKVSAIGDVIHTLPAVFYLKKCYPNAKISWVVQKKAADLLKNQPFLNEVFVLPDKFLHPKNWLASLKIIKELRKTEWDAILDFQGIDKTSFIIAFLKGKKFGFSPRLARSKFSTWFTQVHVDVEFKNVIQKNLALASYAAQELGKTENLCAKQCPTIPELKKAFNFRFGKAEIQAVDQWLTENRITDKFILLCPNTTWETKHWPNELWLEFIEMMFTNPWIPAQASHKATPGRLVVHEGLWRTGLNQVPAVAEAMTDKQDDKKLLLVGQPFGKAADKIAQLCQEKNLPILIVPAWNLNATAYLISKTDLLIAPDTGLLHLADFLDITTIGIFDPTSKKLQGPFLKDINIENAIQTGNISQTGFQANNNTNKSNFQKSTPYQTNMCKLQPSMLFDKVLHILKNKN
ncbi:MAG: Lipopolysaccharide heptosyltransferase I [candidate division TM6 bacterium GW2011_GWF2_36_6]|nr:MAG: Lipopolysaccharide heptosyltransferase I [candidate division TM6 bacterium GW2011_GWF2_36_6]